MLQCGGIALSECQNREKKKTSKRREDAKRKREEQKQRKERRRKAKTARSRMEAKNKTNTKESRRSMRATKAKSQRKQEAHERRRRRRRRRRCWTPPRLPASCVCGQAFTVEHALSCSHGGYLGLRHNEVRDLLGEVLDEICVNVSLDPSLKPLDGEQLAPTVNSSESARVDIKAGGFWGESRHECAFFDVRVFYPHARSHRHRSLPHKNKRSADNTKNVS